MKTHILISFIMAFALSAVFGPMIIPILKRIKAGQTEREDGPESHLSKTGTPTMGAFIFIIPFFIVCLFLFMDYPKTFPILLLTLGFGLIGFADDYIKVVMKRSEGFTPQQKILAQIAVAGIYSIYHFVSNGGRVEWLIPFAGNATVSMGWIAIPISMFIIVGVDNGSNFTDGVDGLETSVTAVICAFLMVVSLGMKAGVDPACAAMAGALLGFLMFNVNKAEVFMGDTGALALGGFVSACAFEMGLELYLPIICVVYFAEVLSVIIQVVYFKRTHGKRLFRMAPIHHHFELGGWCEAKVVGIFTIITTIVCAFCLLCLPIF